MYQIMQKKLHSWPLTIIDDICISLYIVLYVPIDIYSVTAIYLLSRRAIKPMYVGAKYLAIMVGFNVFIFEFGTW